MMKSAGHYSRVDGSWQGNEEKQTDDLNVCHGHYAKIMFYQIKETLCYLFYFVLSRFLSMSTVPVQSMIKRMNTFLKLRILYI